MRAQIAPLAVLLVGLAVAGSAWVPPAGAGQIACVGDCDGDGAVTIGDLTVGVNIALGRRALDDCAAFDANGDGAVGVNELVTAVGNALNDCLAGTVAEGLRLLALADVSGARRAFAGAAAAQPADQAAQLYAVLSGLAVELLDNASLRQLLAASGIRIDGTLAAACDLCPQRPIVFPDTAPSLGETIETARGVLLPRIEQALGALAALSPDLQVGFDLVHLPARCVRLDLAVERVEIDRADVLALRAALGLTAGVLDMLSAYAIPAGLDDFDAASLRELLEASPALFTLQRPDRLASARTRLEAAAVLAVQSVDATAAETDDQSDDLLIVAGQDELEAEQLRLVIDLLRLSLRGQVTFPSMPGVPTSQRLNLSPLFSGQIPSLRPFLAFDAEGDLDQRRFPDPTFGGIAPDLTQDGIDEIIDGGPLCRACQVDAECEGLGGGELSCAACAFDCRGTTRRCTNFDFVECADGFF